jgi:starch synthase
VNDLDMPLIIKVASIPKENTGLFIDNDEYFKRKATFADEEVMYPDNDERAIFFAKRSCLKR